MSNSFPPAAPPSKDSYGDSPAAAGRRNVLAIVSLILGIVGFLFSGYGVISLAALVTGLLARNQIQKTGQRGRGLALAGIILGAVGVVVVVVLLLLGNRSIRA